MVHNKTSTKEERERQIKMEIRSNSFAFGLKEDML